LAVLVAVSVASLMAVSRRVFCSPNTDHSTDDQANKKCTKIFSTIVHH
jgi:hypothetical protein